MSAPDGKPRRGMSLLARGICLFLLFALLVGGLHWFCLHHYRNVASWNGAGKRSGTACCMTARYISLRRRSVPPVSPAAAFPKTICLAKSDRRGAMRSGTITLSTGLRLAPVSRGTATCSSCMRRRLLPLLPAGSGQPVPPARNRNLCPAGRRSADRIVVHRRGTLVGEEHWGLLEKSPPNPSELSRIIWLSGIGTVARFRAFLYLSITVVTG